MPKFIYSFVILILYLCLQAFVSSDAQLTEFRSIDCGAASSYEDAELGLKWETDDNYTKTGITRQMKEGEFPQFMVLGVRLNMGPKPGGNSFFRYPDDDFDRFWQPAVPPRFPSFATIDESSFIENLTLFTYTPASGAGDGDGYNWPPNRTVIDAWVGPQLAFTIPRSRVDTDKLYASFYVAEIRPEFNITAWDVYENSSYAVDDTSDNASIEDRMAHTFFLNEVVLKDPKIIHVNVSSSSVDGVILNGFEYYYLYDFDISATYSIDEKALDGLQESFGLQDWQGDPCFPVAWDWLTCDPEASRIQKLKLSHMNLSGPIPENISNLVELTEIYLDNNSLEGSIPESLASLPKLQILALDNNKLTGEIPPGLKNRLGFTFTGNPGLSGAGSGATAQAPGSQPSPKSAAVRTIRKTDILLLGMVLWASLFLQVSI
ncbi:hypothetical protein R1flu_022998 [Riccia fluitans]|uniref:Malectin-like domain-containing protein n=1 Tax=Riccia fluitans TaxID=41844 RepID=A0ABD1XTT2_9MARC